MLHGFSALSSAAQNARCEIQDEIIGMSRLEFKMTGERPSKRDEGGVLERAGGYFL
ncbi:MAG: hypothetical protein ACT4NX_06140 [Deltaproteobacteria bacterium]